MATHASRFVSGPPHGFGAARLRRAALYGAALFALFAGAPGLAHAQPSGASPATPQAQAPMQAPDQTAAPAQAQPATDATPPPKDKRRRKINTDDLGIAGGRRKPAGMRVPPFLAAAPASVIIQPQLGPPPTPPIEADTALGDNGFYLEANEMIDDDPSKTITAVGKVQARYRSRTLRADKVIYKTDTKEVTAIGNVVIVNPDSTIQYAKELVLDGDLKSGVALGFATRLQNNGKLAAASAIHRSDTVNELNKAIYTACDTCKADGVKPKTPSWSVTADRVVQDKVHRTIYYHNAVIRVKGVPVFFAPIFWHADPTAGAQSGLLAPRVSITSRRGVSIETPYYFSISPSQDLVLSPLISVKVNPLLNGEWRKVFSNGGIDARFGYTYDKQFDASGDPLANSKATSRSYILASGAFDLAPNWIWGFAAERVSDPLLFDRYDVPDVYEKRGLYETDTRRLLSQIYAIREDQTSYASIAVLDFQGIQPDPNNPALPEPNGSIPIIAPLIEGRWTPKTPVIGGQLTLSASAVALFRQESELDADLPGVDTRRATAQLDWRRTLPLPAGLRLEPFLQGRFDLYDESDLPLPDTHQTTTRELGTIGANLSWPFIRQSGSSTIILEPLIQGAISPDPVVKAAIPDLDAVDLVFDETNLFDANRVPGYDIYDAGARLNVGGRASVFWGNGREARLLIGQSFRNQANPMIPVASGYHFSDSDYVVAGSASPMKGISLYGRAIVDNDSLALERTEFGVNFTNKWVAGYVRYLDDKTDPLETPQNLEAAADIYVTKNWGLIVGGTRDLQSDQWTRADLGVIYRDECTRIEVVFHHEAASVRLGGPSDSVQVRLILATLGDPGYRDYSGRW